MNKIKNKVMLIGHLGADPDFKEFDNGKKMAKFSVATSDYYKNAQDERVTDTQWHHMVAWGPLAEIAKEHLKKGVEVAIDGKLTYRVYEDKDGKRNNLTEIIVNEFVKFTKSATKAVPS
ncbi:MAG: single-strand DNA-binding protein [Sphingobacteriales bacterium]|jgi:single-strand DNA-binding protein